MIDTRPGGADLRGQHRPGRVSRCSRLSGVIEATVMLYPAGGVMYRTSVQHRCTRRWCYTCLTPGPASSCRVHQVLVLMEECCKFGAWCRRVWCARRA